MSYFAPHSNYLYLSQTRLWSVLTYMFVYDGSGNIEVFIMLLAFYLIASYRFAGAWKLKMSKFLTGSMFFIAIISGIYWIIMFPQSQGYGQSGVIYALYGMIFMICLLNPILYFLDASLSSKQKKHLKENNLILATTLISLSVFLWIIIQLIISKTNFFNEYTGIGYQLHIVSFLLGIIMGTFGFFYINRLTKE
ncbi:hypothetical protein ACNF40_07035 [Cuniculiplasma sp. SKW4]|uniref:hypothetical protein n=1 Tax=Cuniculiplasma sp. SKW4 TaxID=3400171 RepID=UPI003FD4EBE1